MHINKVPSCYSEEQVRAFLKKAEFPSFTDDSPLPPPTLDTLRKIILQHLMIFPFENTEMHFTESHIMNVEPQALYTRFVADGKGGSYCCGMNGILLGMLRALGYPGYAAAARANTAKDPKLPPKWTPLNHATLLVEPSDAPIQIVDVGYGGHGLCGPLELAEGAVGEGCYPEQHMVSKGLPGEAAVADQPGWIVSWRSGDDPWLKLYQFSEAEVYPSDYDSLSFAFCGREAGGPFWHDVMAMKIIKLDNGHLGRMTTYKGEVRKREGGKVEVLETYSTEPGRLAALSKYFGIHISDEELKHMEGRSAALPKE